MRITKEMKWPELRLIERDNPNQKINRLVNFFDSVRRIISQRDNKIAQAINAADIEITDSVPSDAPEFGQPCLRIYANGGTYRLYIYVDSGWRYTALT
jgi:hypothetical protein